MATATRKRKQAEKKTTIPSEPTKEEEVVYDQFQVVEGVWTRWMEQLVRADATFGLKGEKDAASKRIISLWLLPAVQADRDGLGMNYISQRSKTFQEYLSNGPGASPWARHYSFPLGDDNDDLVVRTLLPVDPDDQAVLSMHGVSIELRTKDAHPPPSIDQDYEKLMREQLTQLRELTRSIEQQCHQTNVLLATKPDASSSYILNGDASPLLFSTAELANIRSHLVEHQARRIVPPFCRPDTHAKMSSVLQQIKALLPLPPVDI